MKKLLFLLLLWPFSLRSDVRLYFPSGATTPVNVPYGLMTGWTDTTQAVRRHLAQVREGSAMTDATVNALGGGAELVLSAVYVSEPIIGKTITGTVKGNFRCTESNAGFNGTVAIAIGVVSADGQTLRGTLLAVSAADATTTPPEFATSVINRKLMDAAESASLSLSAITAITGDRIAVWMGVRENTTITTRTGSINFGDNSATDLAEDETSTAANNPWFEFSAPLTFANQLIDSVILRPNGDFSNTGNRWREDTLAYGTHCGTSNLWFRIKEAGSGNNDTNFVEVDNDFLQATCALSGCFAYNSDNSYNIDFDDYSAVKGIKPDSFAVYVRSKTCNGDSTTVYFDFQGQFGTRFGLASFTGSYVTKRVGSTNNDGIGNPLTFGLMDSLNVKLKTYLGIVLNGEFHATQVYVVAYYNKEVTPTEQAGRAPDPGVGDTLFPIAAGDSTQFTKGCAGAANWNCVDEIPGACGCEPSCVAAGDTNYTISDTALTDFYRLGTQGTHTRWGIRSKSASTQVDCLAMVICVNRSSGGSGAAGSKTLNVQFGLKDSSGNKWQSPEFSTTATGKKVYTWYFPNKTQNGNTRWDSVSMAGLQAFVRFRGTGSTNPSSVPCVISNLYVLVYTSTRSTAIADSTNSDMQKRIFFGTDVGTTGFTLNRQSASWQSSVTTAKIWTGLKNGNNWILRASNDSGLTWTYLTNSNGADTVRIAINPITNGIRLSGDFKANYPDSFYISAQNGAQTGILDSLEGYRTLSPSQSHANLTNRYFHQSNRLVAFNFPQIFTKGDTVWTLGATATTGLNRIKWLRSIDGGTNWPDTGYLPGPKCVGDADTGTIDFSNGKYAATFVKWTGNNPAIFIYGWVNAPLAIRFLQWHPSHTNVDSIRLLSWTRNAGAAYDTITFNSVTSAGGGDPEMVASSIFRGNAPTAHAAIPNPPYILHVSVDSSLVKSFDTVADFSQITATPSMKLSMAAKDSVLYLYAAYPQKPNNFLDSSQILYAIYDNVKKRFKGWRPLSFWHDSLVCHALISTAQYQKGTYSFGVFSDTTRTFGTYRYLDFNRIIQPQAAAGGGATTPLRRRRIILEKQKPYGEKREKDTFWNGFVFEPVPDEK